MIPGLTLQIKDDVTNLNILSEQDSNLKNEMNTAIFQLGRISHSFNISEDIIEKRLFFLDHKISNELG